MKGCLLYNPVNCWKAFYPQRGSNQGPQSNKESLAHNLITDDVTKAKGQMRIRNIVAITGSCVGLVFLAIIGLLILTVIKNRRKRNLRKGHIREIPTDYMVIYLFGYKTEIFPSKTIPKI